MLANGERELQTVMKPRTTCADHVSLSTDLISCACAVVIHRYPQSSMLAVGERELQTVTKSHDDMQERLPQSADA